MGRSPKRCLTAARRSPGISRPIEPLSTVLPLHVFLSISSGACRTGFVLIVQTDACFLSDCRYYLDSFVPCAPHNWFPNVPATSSCGGHCVGRSMANAPVGCRPTVQPARARTHPCVCACECACTNLARNQSDALTAFAVGSRRRALSK